ncbi:MAG: ribosomal protein S18-alanine N-acetyltransferase [Nitrospirae bacterium]|nr:ribosomal protein S18-alanine N-acetyltransferase [Nitrospirota bacterium]
MLIRKADASDLPEIMEIEKASFTLPWSRGSFKYELMHKEALFKAAVSNGKIIGYICARVIIDTVHILNLAVRPEIRRTGIGGALLQHALEEFKKSAQGVNFVILEVRESNTPAIRLYEKFGFNIMHKRRHYYQLPDEDAVVMGKDLRNAGENP